LENWTIRNYNLEGGEEPQYTDMLLEANRTVACIYDDRDIWLQIFDSNWASNKEWTRVTMDYPYNYGGLMKIDDSYYILGGGTGIYADKYLKAQDQTLTSWDIIGNWSPIY
jgi:hypothetical protein